MIAEALALLDFVNAELLRATPHRARLDTPLFDDGLIDSLKILRLIAFVETRTGRSIPDEEIVMANFRTVRTVAAHFFAPQAPPAPSRACEMENPANG